MLRKKVWLTEDVPVTHTNVGNHVFFPPPENDPDANEITLRTGAFLKRKRGTNSVKSHSDMCSFINWRQFSIRSHMMCLCWTLVCSSM